MGGTDGARKLYIGTLLVRVTVSAFQAAPPTVTRVTYSLWGFSCMTTSGVPICCACEQRITRPPLQYICCRCIEDLGADDSETEVYSDDEDLNGPGVSFVGGGSSGPVPQLGVSGVGLFVGERSNAASLADSVVVDLEKGVSQLAKS